MPISFLPCMGCAIGEHDHHVEPRRGWRAIFTNSVCLCRGGCAETFEAVIRGIVGDPKETRP